MGQVFQFENITPELLRDKLLEWAYAQRATPDWPDWDDGLYSWRLSLPSPLVPLVPFSTKWVIVFQPHGMDPRTPDAGGPAELYYKVVVDQAGTNQLEVRLPEGTPALAQWCASLADYLASLATKTVAGGQHTLNRSQHPELRKDIDEIHRMWRDGYTDREIAKAIGKTPDTVHYHRQRHGWTKPRKGRVKAT